MAPYTGVMTNNLPDLKYIETLVKLVLEHKLDILEVNGIKIIKQDHTPHASPGVKDMFEGKTPEMTEDERDDLLFAHEGF